MRIRRLLELFAYLLALILIETLLIRFGHGALAMPWDTGQSWRNWFLLTDYPTMAFAILRVLALAVTMYMITSMLLLCLAATLRLPRLTTMVAVLSTPFSRRIAQRALGLTLAGMLSAPVAAGASEPQDVPIMRHLTASESNPVFPRSTTTAVVPTVDIREPVARSNDDLRTTHIVVEGESLWSIAEVELGISLDRSPTLRETRVYWLALIRANRTLLPDPSLIHPGQALELPNSALPVQ